MLLSDITPLVHLFGNNSSTAPHSAESAAQLTTIRQECSSDVEYRGHDDFAPLACSSPTESEQEDADQPSPNLQQATRAPKAIGKRARTEAEKIAAFARKHQVRPLPKYCQDGCKRRCKENISESQRRKINQKVNSMSLSGRRQWYIMYVKGNDIKGRRKENQKPGTNHKKTKIYEWSLPGENMSKVTVCKGFFLTTLGFSPSTAEQVIRVVQTADVCSDEGRSGGHLPGNKVDRYAIKDHIWKYHPMRHHYRYRHAPNRLYLPADITIQMMYDAFLENPDTKSCSYETFRKVVEEMNIGFTTLSGEECSRCSVHMQHMADQHNVTSKEANFHDDKCDQCKKHKGHMAEAKIARDAYRADADTPSEDGSVCFSADMMRVFMLPQLPLKEAFFTPKLSCFNETFALLMPYERQDSKAKKQKMQKLNTCVVWHDGLAGRGSEEVAAAFYLFLTTTCRDVKHVILWADNCAAQQKNWVLMTTLLQAIHSPNTGTETISIKYLEPGHTSMSADAIHQVVSKNLKRLGMVQDIQDYITATEDAGVKVTVMQPGVNMVKTEDCISRPALKTLADQDERPYIADFKLVQVRRGSRELWTKKSLLEPSWTTYSLLKNTSSVDEQPPMIRHRTGTASKERLEGICTKLVPHMPRHKRVFWEELLEMSGARGQRAPSEAPCRTAKRRSSASASPRPRKRTR